MEIKTAEFPRWIPQGKEVPVVEDGIIFRVIYPRAVRCFCTPDSERSASALNGSERLKPYNASSIRISVEFQPASPTIEPNGRC
jgi:hypothetical protein